MSNSLLSGKVVTMSSREIAELVQSKHSDVKRSAERLVVGGVLTAPLAQFEFVHNGNTYTEYRFSKRDSLVLVAQLSPQFTAAVVDRWQELEANSQVPQTLPEALRLAADLAEEKQVLESQLALAAPKVEFVEQYVMAKGSMGFRSVCKLLKAKEPEFRLFMIDEKIVYKQDGQFTPYSVHTDAGRFEVKTGTSQVNQHAFRQARFTPKGVQWIAGLWGDYLRKKQEAAA
ncbi:phage antirepressor KilAC domain-containing protein [Rahnella contaminans]|uniref:phage antirepressor KilAC domain-containing protein n=1 Tax=Rahnella contaminans TaxID=2703882 RepID=UPI0023DA1814|nr:DNA-binding protein [Rahnella contaminans]MDF1895106.1 phage antirepressor KilAC domain-containing protein [Rahnella contaminans]